MAEGLTEETREALYARYQKLWIMKTSGVLSSKHDDKSVTFRSMAELDKAIWDLEDLLGLPSTRPRHRRTRIAHRRIGVR